MPDLRKCQTLISTFDSVHWWQALTASYLQHVSTSARTHTHSARKAGKVRFERRTAHRERKSKLAQGRFGPGEPSACLPEWNCHCWEQSEPGSSPSRPKLPQALFAAQWEPSPVLLLQLTFPYWAPSPHFPLNPSIEPFLLLYFGTFYTYAILVHIMGMISVHDIKDFGGHLS